MEVNLDELVARVGVETRVGGCYEALCLELRTRETHVRLISRAYDAPRISWFPTWPVWIFDPHTWLWCSFSHSCLAFFQTGMAGRVLSNKRGSDCQVLGRVNETYVLPYQDFRCDPRLSSVFCSRIEHVLEIRLLGLL